MLRELGHFHTVSRQNCTEVTVLPHTSVILSAGTTRTSCSGRGQKLHYVTLYAQGMEILFLYYEEGLFISPQNGTCLSHPWCVWLQILLWVIKSIKLLISVKKKKKKKKKSNINKQRQTCLHGCTYTLSISNRQHSLLSSVLLQKPGCKLGNLEISNSCIRQGATGRHGMQVTGFPHILIIYSPGRMDGNSRGRTQ